MKAAIYARVSTDDQDCGIQLERVRDHARRWDWEAVEYVEKASGKEGGRRAELQRLLQDASRREFDLVLVAKLDRFGRSTLDTLTNVRALGECGIRFIALQEGIDTNDRSATGKFTLTVFAAVAELERSFIVERTQAGHRAYRDALKGGDKEFARFIATRGRHSKSGRDLPVGRPKRIFDRKRLMALAAQGLSRRAIARAMRISLGTVQRSLTGQV
jgi:DNA invertase Pin-like site-specific DNA recombinase